MSGLDDSFPDIDVLLVSASRSKRAHDPLKDFLVSI